jgi:hypothetical protein
MAGKGRVTGRQKLRVCPSKRKAEEDAEAQGKVFAHSEAVEAPAKGKTMLMAHEDIESILTHKARGRSFKEFQARVAKEVEETGEFVMSEEHMKNVQETRAWFREQILSLRSDYPDVVFED